MKSRKLICQLRANFENSLNQLVTRVKSHPHNEWRQSFYKLIGNLKDSVKKQKTHISDLFEGHRWQCRLENSSKYLLFVRVLLRLFKMLLDFFAAVANGGVSYENEDKSYVLQFEDFRGLVVLIDYLV